MSTYIPGDISPQIDAETRLFTGYGTSWLRINQMRYESGLILHEGEVIAPWGPQRIEELRTSHLEIIFENQPSVLLIGTGRLTCFPPLEVLNLLRDNNIGFECMDSRSAARTYNILIGEGRPVSAAMLLPGAE
ncbi:MAG: hypothetical protein D6703_06290 [Zetaproteobacteria bacterium]|nr:MAG: hypothetical protein D6703_06290 [Zetaproteobacteria bacterium]